MLRRVTAGIACGLCRILQLGRMSGWGALQHRGGWRTGCRHESGSFPRHLSGMRTSKCLNICCLAATIALLPVVVPRRCAWAGFAISGPFVHVDSPPLAAEFGSSRRDDSRDKALDHWCRDAYGWCLSESSSGGATRASGIATAGWNHRDWAGSHSANPHTRWGGLASSRSSNGRSDTISSSHRSAFNSRSASAKHGSSRAGNASKQSLSWNRLSSDLHDRRGSGEDEWRDRTRQNDHREDFGYSSGFSGKDWFSQDGRHDRDRNDHYGWGGWPGSHWDSGGKWNGHGHGGGSGGGHFPHDFDWDCWRPGWGKHDGGGDRDRCDRFVWCHDTHHDHWWKDCRDNHHSDCEHRPPPCRDYPPWCHDGHHCRPSHCRPDPCHPHHHCPVPAPSTLALSASGLVFAGLWPGVCRLLRRRRTD